VLQEVLDDGGAEIAVTTSDQDGLGGGRHGGRLREGDA
jgi:hypothetical protein